MHKSMRAVLEGVRAEFPLLIGVFPFGLIYGALALAAGLAPAEAQAMSSIVFAGASQFITAQLVHEAAPAAVIVLSIAIVNLRHMLYSATVAPYLRELPLRWKALLAYLLTDEAFAAAIAHYDNAGLTPTGHWFFLGAGLSLWLTWQVSSALGIFLGTAIPRAWPLDFALPLTFTAMLMPMLKDRALVVAALAAGVVATAANGLPDRLGIIAAAAVGIAAGLYVERRR